ncbi:hypothetical protein N9L47_03615 [Rhodobacteraceae bacterium]|nr:hypothetical protein [Paracoccaceae bacterium]
MIKLTNLSYIAFSVAVLASPAVGEPFDVPLQYCEALYSVQKRQCEVEHVRKCSFEGQTYWHYETWDPEDGTFTEITNESGDIISAFGREDDIIIDSVIEISDPLSIRSILSNGEDSFDSRYNVRIPIFLDPIPSRMSGHAISQNTSETIDGVLFKRYRLSMKLQLNALILEGYEDLYIDPETEAVVSGEVEFSFDGGRTTDIEFTTPAEVILEGESGFLADLAFYDCGEMTALDEKSSELAHARKN